MLDIKDVGVIVAIIGAALSFVYSSNRVSFWAGKVLEKMDSGNKAFARFETDFKNHMLQEEQIQKALWTKIDSHSETIVEHGQRIKFVEKAIENK